MPFWTPSFLEASFRTPFGETSDMKVSGAYFPSLFSFLGPGRLPPRGAACPARKV